MAKCDICGNKLAELFLGKIKGAIIRKEGSSKHYSVCFECQKKFKSKQEMLKNL
ncbi:MAG TPA: hypothetical protein VJC39_03355 [Candidatus Nanoarchaeia archaeon]|nr:hypothetical protein [Candidatus Nanoarchaeia archaeon]